MTDSNLIQEQRQAKDQMDIDQVLQTEELTGDKKIRILPGASEDITAATFEIDEEDHTLGNALRYMIMKNNSPGVEFCGYSIPHPSETKVNIRVQTYGEGVTAIDALDKGLSDLVDLCNHVEETFIKQMEQFKSQG
ncbi:DNA-directed RNA polymerases I and III subunit RPAC2 [Neolecta irregularis DAH-3]|uniref:DNA-directed RNA polymerases I and III subunit RPAC2 n=1 Tax=Neolecta irregularis (strain DAH-3) TaxID=1198029 RepID=A0A1U7LWM8_NEOID|nr:DNA-directed RNA polymerases I and III subunit RPAC2 [Neolecta irregularis DAH-3]|eukprot:OLL27029.1 DNA-directed RNA polymerases I and III subunit RPAC2 [Neolecta irregularis DAH-3]